MPLNHPKSGISNVDEFRISGIPFLTASTLSRNDTFEIIFPEVTKTVYIRNDESQTTRLSCGFSLSGTISSSLGLGRHFIDVGENQTTALDIRANRLFLSNSLGNNTNGSLKFQVLASLTKIPAKSLPEMTGSINGTGSYKGIG